MDPVRLEWKGTFSAVSVSNRNCLGEEMCQESATIYLIVVDSIP